MYVLSFRKVLQKFYVLNPPVSNAPQACIPLHSCSTALFLHRVSVHPLSSANSVTALPMSWWEVCFMLTQRRLRYSRFTLWTVWIVDFLKHQGWTSGMCQIPCPTRTSSTEGWFRKIQPLAKERTGTILLPPDRETLWLWLPTSTVQHQANPTCCGKAQKTISLGQESPEPNRNDTDLNLSCLCCPFYKGTLQEHIPTWVFPRHRDSSAPRLQAQSSLYGQSGRYFVSRKMSVWLLKKSKPERLHTPSGTKLL